MNLRTAFFVFITCLSVASLTACQRDQQEASIHEAINTVLHDFSGDPSVGIIIDDLNTQKTLYQLHPTRSFTPGSTTKVLTATAALAYLGPNYRFRTSLSRVQPLQNHTLPGNLYLNFSGDPSLTVDDVQHLLSQLSQQHITQVEGNIVITTSNIAPYQPGPGFMWDDQQFGYAAPSTAVVLNRNQFTFRLYSADQLGKPPYVVSQKPMPWNQVHVNAITALNDSVDCTLDMHSTADNQYTITGCMPYNQAYFDFSVAIKNPRYRLQHVIRAWLSANDIHLQGDIVGGSLPVNSKLIGNHDSKPLSHLIKHMLHTSDNLYANLIFKTLGAIYEDGPGTWHNGQKAVLAILQSLGIDSQGIDLVDGAGLSRYNHFTPQTLASIIRFHYTHPSIGQYFFKALPINGVSGTIKHFLLGPYTGDLKAKTGSMTYVASVAGTLNTGSHPLAVVIMINGTQDDKTYFKLIHDIVFRLAQLNTQ